MTKFPNFLRSCNLLTDNNPDWCQCDSLQANSCSDALPLTKQLDQAMVKNRNRWLNNVSFSADLSWHSVSPVRVLERSGCESKAALLIRCRKAVAVECGISHRCSGLASRSRAVIIAIIPTLTQWRSPLSPLADLTRKPRVVNRRVAQAGEP